MPDDPCATAASKCSAEAAGYDGMFGVYCDLPDGHEGLHNDGHVEWRFVNPDFEPARAAELYRQEQESRRADPDSAVTGIHKDSTTGGTT